MSENVLRWIVAYYRLRSNFSSLSDGEFKKLVIFGVELNSIEESLSKEEKAELRNTEEYKGLMQYIHDHELWD